MDCCTYDDVVVDLKSAAADPTAAPVPVVVVAAPRAAPVPVVDDALGADTIAFEVVDHRTAVVFDVEMTAVLDMDDIVVRYNNLRNK